MSLKGNFQNLFLSKSVKRGGSSQEKQPLIKTKVTPSTGKLSGNLQKTKPLNFMFSASSFERKPVFRITSLSQNMFGSMKGTEKEEKEESVRRFHPYSS
jgi:hypothetical protein